MTSGNGGIVPPFIEKCGAPLGPDIEHLEKMDIPLIVIMSIVFIGADRVKDVRRALDLVDRDPAWSASVRLLRLRAALVGHDRPAADALLRGLGKDDSELGALAAMAVEMLTEREVEHERLRAGAYLWVATLAAAEMRGSRPEYDPQSWDVGHRRVSKPLDRSVTTLPS